MSRRKGKQIVVRVIIPEAIPSLNKGEKAILEGIKVALSVIKDVSITLFSPWYEADRKRYAEDITLVTGFNYSNSSKTTDSPSGEFSKSAYIKKWGKFVAFACIARFSRKAAEKVFKDELHSALTKADLILVGHDGCMSPELFWFVLAGNIMRKPVTMYGLGGESGAAELYAGINKIMLRYAFNHTIFNAIRDCGTRQFLLNHGVKEEKIHLCPDPAVLMKPCAPERAEDILRSEKAPVSGVPIFGLIPVRGGVVFEESFLKAGNIQEKCRMRVDFWTELVVHLLKNTNAHFVFLPHCIGPGSQNDDRTIATEIAAGLGEYKDRVTCIINEYGAKELKGVMKRCDFVLSERTHALIGAVSVATPCMALAVKEDHRMHNIVNKMFNRPVYDINEPDMEDLKQSIMAQWNNRRKIKEEMITRADIILKEAYETSTLLRDRFLAHSERKGQ